MVVIDRVSGQGVIIGPYTIRVLEIGPGAVVMALEGPDEDTAVGGAQPADGCRLAAAARPTDSPTLARPGAPAPK
jgi:hypothetical protein